MEAPRTRSCSGRGKKKHVSCSLRVPSCGVGSKGKPKRKPPSFLFVCGCFFWGGASPKERCTHTADGQNPAPVGRWFMPSYTGFHPYQLVQNFVHPQRVLCFSLFFFFGGEAFLRWSYTRAQEPVSITEPGQLVYLQETGAVRSCGGFWSRKPRLKSDQGDMPLFLWAP